MQNPAHSVHVLGVSPSYVVFAYRWYFILGCRCSVPAAGSGWLFFFFKIRFRIRLLQIRFGGIPVLNQFSEDCIRIKLNYRSGIFPIPKMRRKFLFRIQSGIRIKAEGVKNPARRASLCVNKSSPFLNKVVYESGKRNLLIFSPPVVII
jgi:hypothetical protein